ncbi:MAG: rhodanese-like domain-containing protein [Bdellovibrionota bacterium]
MIKKSINLLLLTAATFALAACSTPPATKTYETQDVETQILFERISKPIKITEKTIIVDARSSFDFAMTHAPGSVNLSWKEFAVVKPPVPGLMKDDLYPEALRLARLGIQPNSSVVIASYGDQSKGDEGRLAWTLIYMGVKDVQIASLDSLGLRFSNLVNPPPQASAVPWKPVVAPSILTDRKEVLSIGLTKAVPTQHILDVRTNAEYTEKVKVGFKTHKPDLRAVNIPFNEFFDRSGRPNLNMVQRLQGIQIKPEHRIVVISNNGIRSGAVTFALLSMGYKNVANYAGGWTDLLNSVKGKRARK